MQKIIIALLLAMLATGAQATDVTSEDGKISFTVPDDFAPLNDEERSAKYPAGNAPRYLVGNATRTTNIAYDIKSSKIEYHDLLEFQSILTESFARAVPNVQFVMNDIRTMNGRQWIYIELTSAAYEADIHNIILVTPYKDDLLMFTFASTKKEFPLLKDALRASIKSIRITK